MRFALPAAIATAPKDIIDKIGNEDIKINGFSKKVKMFFIEQYETECFITNCYVCNEIQPKNDQPE